MFRFVLAVSMVIFVASGSSAKTTFEQEFVGDTDDIDATPQESYDEIQAILQNHACGGRNFRVRVKHPFITIDYREPYEFSCAKGSHYFNEINFKLITWTRVHEEGNIMGNWVAVEFGCSNLCFYSWEYSGINENTIRNSVPSSGGTLFSTYLDRKDAIRVAKALKHLGVIYGASNPRNRDKFD